MKTKIYIISIILVALIGATSCSDWLDVNPKGVVDDKEAFNSEKKFKEVLTGAYIMLASDRLYGLYGLTVPEGLARNWTVPVDKNKLMYKLGNHQYGESAVAGPLTVLWSDFYKTILQLNILLERLDDTDVSFTNNNDKLLRGEALGLRAFIHLEILRLYGPVPDAAGMSQLAIPYVAKVTKNPNDLVSLPWATVVENIEKDLNEAEKLLEGIDPILLYSNDALNGRYTLDAPEDSWQHGRQSRFNYFAVLGTKARLYQWMGKKELAIEYAKRVIETPEDKPTIAGVTTKFTLSDLDYIKGTAVADKNLVMRNEHLFGLHITQMIEPPFQLLFYSASGATASTFYLRGSDIDLMFENDALTDDYRSPKTTIAVTFWDGRSETVNPDRYHNYRKYTWPASATNINRMSLIRLSELYFILIENTPIEEAKTYLKAFRQSRATNIEIENDLTVDNRLSRLEKEHRKEFLAEGQMFFFYKRNKYLAFPFPDTYVLPSLSTYVLPKPDNQVIFE